MTFALVLVFGFLAQDPSAAEVRSATGVEAGLVVRLGTTDGALEVDLARGGWTLVHGLAAEHRVVSRARAAAFEAGLAGRVLFERLPSDSRLPYARNSVNLLVADADAPGATIPETAEIDRVLVPRGVAFIRRGGAWQKTVKPWPAEFDDWTHWCYGPEGNPVSRDSAVKPSSSLQWIAGAQAQDARLSRGFLVGSESYPSEGVSKVGSRRLFGRDAFNGILLWRGEGRPRKDHAYRDLCKYELTVGGDRVFYFPKETPGFARALELATGRVLKEYSEGLKVPEVVETRQTGGAFLLACGKVLVQAYRKQVAALDVASGAGVWRYEARNPVAGLAASADGELVFLMESAEGKQGSRWEHFSDLVAVTGLAKGREAWRATDVTAGAYQMLYHDGSVVVFRGQSNMDPKNMGPTQLLRLNAVDGRVIWKKDAPEIKGIGHENSILVRDGAITSWGPFDNLKTYGWADGEFLRNRSSGYNQRCARLTATPEWYLFGLLTYVDRGGNWTQHGVGRSDCSFPVYPAHGQVFVNCNITCTCINALRGEFALSPEVPPPAVPDECRRESLVGTSFRAPVPPASPPSTVTADWNIDPLVFFIRGTKTASAAFGELSISADVQSGRVSAVTDGREVWSFAAGGRAWGAPLVHGSSCFVGSADGWVYSLSAKDGSPRWRFLAAPSERKIVAYGQLESAWPVYGLAMHEGKLCFSAGRHPELDGGLFLWGLEPETGQVAWKVTLHVPTPLHPKDELIGKRGVRYTREMASMTPLNGWLVSEGGELALASPFFDKRGSSPSKTGYFNAEGNVTTFRLPIPVAEWNGQVIDPRPPDPKK